MLTCEQCGGDRGAYGSPEDRYHECPEPDPTTRVAPPPGAPHWGAERGPDHPIAGEGPPARDRVS